MKNLNNLIANLKNFRAQWPSIFQEAKLVAGSMNIDAFSPETRKRRKKYFIGEVKEDTDILGDSAVNLTLRKMFSLK